MRLDLKYMYNDRIYLKLVLIILFLSYCYLSILPKHVDFYALSTVAQVLAKEHFDLSKIYINYLGNMHPPLFYLIDGAWLKLGSLLHIYSLDSLHNLDNLPPNGQYANPFIQFWCMLPYLLLLLACTIISYRSLRNKWLSILWFGAFTFISVGVMGQTDIMASFFILISVVLMIKSFYSNNYLLYMYLYLSLVSLGLSTLVKTYSFLLLPLYISISIKLIDQRIENNISKIKIFSGLLIIVTSVLVSPILTYGKYVSGMVSRESESSWAFNLRTNGIEPFNTISIWLLGYCIINYIMAKRISKNRSTREYKELFVFFGMLNLSWFFISVFTHPQWWVILVPFIIAVLDNFDHIYNYILAIFLFNLFLFYPMRWVNGINPILGNYITVVPIEGNDLMFLVTLLAATLIIWAIEIQHGIEDKTEDTEIERKKIGIKNIIFSLILLISPFVFNWIYPMISAILRNG